ncbi:MAG TPA: amidohydrolase family protein [Streptosporangiaceae bacterium]|jgi:dihydropyrimidinase|nr:amidohydrolase family protein [Streptosporangiaceae bacterium]
MMDLVVRGGEIVTPGHRGVGDVGLRDGRIAQLGGAMTGRAELDAHGLLVVPGGIDAHVHLVCAALAAVLGTQEPFWVDDFWSGSLAAIAGGVTTIGNMTFALPGESMTAAIAREMAGAAAEAAVDWFLHPVLAGLGDGAAAEVAALAADGHTSLKVFLSDPDYAAGTPGLADVIAAAGRAGSLTLVHCEDAGILTRTGQELIGSGRGAMRNFPDARPVSAEVEAVDQAIGLARQTGAPIYIVHLSSAAALDRCEQARAAGVPVYVETRPLYLHLTRELFGETDAGKYVGAPPLRDQSDRDALWRGLAAGEVDTVCSDHAPWTLAAKLDPALDVVTARQGVADLETLMPMLFSEGVLTGRISLDRFVELTSANAARLFGLYPRKGAIAVGSDADLALWDPAERRVIDGARMQSRAGYSVYDGWTVQGWPRYVIRRGQIVLADGSVMAQPGQGQWVHRDEQPK